MRLYSTQGHSPPVSFREGVLRGMPPDGGLYMPAEIPPLKKAFFHRLPGMELREIALEVSRCLLGESLPEAALKAIIEKAVTFDAPLVQLDAHLFVLELFHGPTLAFKDFAARFMAALLDYYARTEGGTFWVLVATSGDTGSAVAAGFRNTPGVRVVVLYPSGKVSPLQERQLTTPGGNITAVEVQGSFDDCQRLVKQAFADEELARRLRLTSANSINIARLIPQTFYYFRALAQLPNAGVPVVISVPSGNFGNLTAGLIAKRMGLPVHRFVAATNINDVVPRYLRTGEFRPRPSSPTLSNAMDVGNPGNFARMLALYHHSREALCRDVAGHAFTDEETLRAIAGVYRRYGYVLDPHGAVGYLGLRRYRKERDEPVRGIFLETAHPAKFADTVEQAIGCPVELPPALQEVLEKPKQALPIPGEFSAFKRVLWELWERNLTA